VGVRVGVAYSLNKLALRTRLRNSHIPISHFSIFDSFRDIRVHTYDFLKFVGGLCAFFFGQSICIDKNNTLEWAWHAAETTMRCVGSSGIFMPSLNSLALIVFEISAFIRTGRQTKRRTDGHG